VVSSPGPASDPHDLARFIEAQADCFDTALAELRAGSKETHWIWFVLPQLRGLGYSHFAQFYGIASLQEAVAYLAHPVLGARLRQCVAAIGAHPQRTAAQILGKVDAVKYGSCLTLFSAAAGPDPLFDEALKQFFGGQRDPKTLALLARLGRA
jgi:uncharacterized protein (DUF1810 family)